MRIIYPIPIVLTSSSISALSDGYSNWSASTTYASGAYVVVAATTPHKIYKSLQNNNLNHAPSQYPEWWQDQGGTNRWKMFDEFLDTQSQAQDEIEVIIRSENCDRFMLLSVEADNVAVQLYDYNTSQIVYEASNTIAGTSYVGKIPVYANSALKITLSKTGYTVKCGICIIGWSTFIGSSQYGISPGIIDYSVKAIDDFGRTYLSTGSWAKQIDMEILSESNTIDAVFSDLVAARGITIGIDANGENTAYDSLNAYGYIRSWKISFDYPTRNKN